MDTDPLFRFTRGNPTAEELAAVVGVLLARRGGPPTIDTAGPSPWVRSARPGQYAAAGLPSRPGSGAWRASALPH